MISSPKPAKFEVASIRLGVKLDYVVPILNFAEFASLLQKSGFTVNHTGLDPIQFIGIRGGVQVYIDGMKGVFGATSRSIDDTAAVIDEIFAGTGEAFDFDLNKYVSFYESEINANYYVRQDVYVIMAGLFQDSSDMKALNKILKGDSAQMSLKLTPKAKNINNPEWFDLTIEPKVNSTGNIFCVRALFRSPNLKDVLDGVKRTEKTVTSIINKVLTK